MSTVCLGVCQYGLGEDACQRCACACYSMGWGRTHVNGLPVRMSAWFGGCHGGGGDVHTATLVHGRTDHPQGKQSHATAGHNPPN